MLIQDIHSNVNESLTSCFYSMRMLMGYYWRKMHLRQFVLYVIRNLNAQVLFRIVYYLIFNPSYLGHLSFYLLQIVANVLKKLINRYITGTKDIERECL